MIVPMKAFEMSKTGSLANQNFIVESKVQRWSQGRNAGGAKTVRVPTASEASKIFTDHTFKIGLKCDYTL